MSSGVGVIDGVCVMVGVLEGVGVGLRPEGMAFGAAHGHTLQGIRHRGAGNFACRPLDAHGLPGGDGGMAAGAPVGNDAGVEYCVALQAFLGGIADRSLLGQTGTNHQGQHQNARRHP